MAVQNFRVGDVVTDTIADVASMCCNITATQYMTLEYPVGTDYQVTAGKTLYIAHLFAASGNSAAAFQIGYADDGVPDQAGAPTTPVLVTQALYLVTAYNQYSFKVWAPIPAEKYPFVKSAAGSFIGLITGIEV